MSRRRRIALLVVMLVQLAVPLALAAVAAADLAFGQEIRLRARPVDPLDIFRGNFVVLRYDISQVAVGDRVRRGEKLCVRLSEQRGVWSGDFAVPDRDREGTAICGRARSDASAGAAVSIEYGIETYFASAERARKIEQSISRDQLYVVVDLDEDGSARIERLEAGGSG